MHKTEKVNYRQFLCMYNQKERMHFPARRRVQTFDDENNVGSFSHAHFLVTA